MSAAAVFTVTFWVRHGGPAGLSVNDGEMRAGFALACLDAPEFMASGGMRWVKCNIRAGGFVGQGLAMRGRYE